MNAQSLLLDASDVRAVVQPRGPGRADGRADRPSDRRDPALRSRGLPDARRAAVCSTSCRNGVCWSGCRRTSAPKGTTVKLVGYHPANPERRGLPTVDLHDLRLRYVQRPPGGTGRRHVPHGAAHGRCVRRRQPPAGAAAEQHARRHRLRNPGGDADSRAVARVSRSRRLSRTTSRTRSPGRCAIASRFSTRRSTIVARERLRDLVGAQPTSSARAHRPRPARDRCSPTSPTSPICTSTLSDPISAASSRYRSSCCGAASCAPTSASRRSTRASASSSEPAEIGPDLRTLVQNAAAYCAARTSPTVFDSTGWALEDHVAALMMFEYARELGLGRPLRIRVPASGPEGSVLPPESERRRDGCIAGRIGIRH